MSNAFGSAPPSFAPERLWCARHLASGHAREALPLARRVRDANPLHEQSWRLLLETHVAAHDPIGAAMEADALAQLLTAEGRAPEPPTRAVLRLAHQTPDDASPGDRGLTAELVGREREFSRIVHTWEDVTRHAGRHLHVVAPAGLGKTRLLAEVQSRLRASGARVISLRAAPGERHISGALIGEVARALASLPGAAGVSPSAAGALVALHPAVSSFYSAPADLTTGEDALRRRTAALAELVAAVADETPLALLLDDLHWADVQSRTVLTSLVGRIAKEPVLILTTARPGEGAAVQASATLRLSLEPLTEPQVRAFLASLGELPDSPWVTMIVPLLYDVAGGSPLLILETLQLALERRVLILSDGGWECPAPEELSRQLRSGSALRHRVASLDRTSAWLLLVLSVAGTPLSTGRLARASKRPQEDVESFLVQLELRGLVSRSGADWEPGHDEIAALAVELAPDAAARAADVDLGHVFLEDAEREPALLAQAGPHLAAAEEHQALKRAYQAWVRRARNRGDRRGLADLATELVGGAREGDLVDRLIKSLPRATRVGLDTPRRVAGAAAVLLVLAVGVGAIALHRTPPPDGLLLALRSGESGATVVQSVELHREGWESVKTLHAGSPSPWFATLSAENVVIPRPGTDQWISSEPVSDSGTIDLFLTTAAGLRKRLTFAPGDDGGQAASPDGRYVAFATARWSRLSHYNIAVLDLVTGTTRRLTHTDATDAPGGWSPDGSRIAVARRYWTARPPELCWVAADASREHCHALTGDVPSIFGWLDSHRVLLKEGSGTAGPLAIADMDDDSLEVIVRTVFDAALSPDGRWLATLEQRSGSAAPEWLVRPMDAPDQTRALSLGSSASQYRLVWLAPGTSPHYLDRLTIMIPGDTVSVGVPTTLSVRGQDSLGRPVDVPALQYTSLDPAHATLDSDGVLMPKHPGQVSVVISAGGWRVDTVRVPIGLAQTETALTEDWRDPMTRWFQPFGIPLPQIVPGPRGHPWFWNAGDGRFTSGVVSRARYSAATGLGVEVEASTPITVDQWQLLNLILTAGLDSLELGRWDHRTGGIPTKPRYSQWTCQAGIPAGEGPNAFRLIGLGSGESTRAIRRPDLLNGSIHRIRIQIFPDGRCGLAIDGRAVGIINGELPPGERYWLLIQGNSADAKVLVGRVELWQGAKTDVDWGRR